MSKTIKCPHCGASYYEEKLSTTTAMYFAPIWKDGVNINPDRNCTTTRCVCLECGKEFLIHYCNGKCEVEALEEKAPNEHNYQQTFTGLTEFNTLQNNNKYFDLGNAECVYVLHKGKKYVIDIDKIIEMFGTEEDTCEK